MFKILQAFILLSLTTPALAISNIEDERPGLPEEGWSGNIELGFDGETGNKSEKDYSAAAKAINRHGDNIYLGIIEREYGTTRNTKDTDDSFVHGRWMHLLNDKWAAEGFVQWEEDQFDNLVSRSLAGGGVRYVVAEDDKVFSLSVGLGGFREREVLDLGTYEDKTWLWRVNSFAVYKHRINDQVNISATAYYQPSTNDLSNFRMLMDATLLVKLTDTLDLKIYYQVTHDSDPAINLAATPPIDNNETNSQYTTALVYSF